MYVQRRNINCYYIISSTSHGFDEKLVPQSRNNAPICIDSIYAMTGTMTCYYSFQELDSDKFSENKIFM